MKFVGETYNFNSANKATTNMKRRNSSEDFDIVQRVTVRRYGTVSCLPTGKGNVAIFAVGLKKAYFDTLGVYCPRTGELFSGALLKYTCDYLDSICQYKILVHLAGAQQVVMGNEIKKAILSEVRNKKRIGC